MIANALHPATYMPTKMVVDAGIDPLSSLEQGLAATLALVQRTDVSRPLLQRAAGGARGRAGVRRATPARGCAR